MFPEIPATARVRSSRYMRTELNSRGATKKGSDRVGVCASGDIDRQVPDVYVSA